MSGTIRQHVRDGAHEIRLLGNEMAHGDLGAKVTAEDAELVLTLMSEVLDDVYQSPARVARAQAAREARKQQQALLEAIREGKLSSFEVSPYAKLAVPPSIKLPKVEPNATDAVAAAGQDANPEPRPSADTAS